MNTALNLAISPGARSIEDLELQPDEVFQNRVRTLCGLFVTIVENRIFLFHQTASEFLIAQDDASQYKGRSVPYPDQWQHSFPPRISHGLCAQICTSFLMFDTFRDRFPNFGNQEFDYEGIWKPSLRKSLLQRATSFYTTESVFLEYAMKSGIEHLVASRQVDTKPSGSIKVAVIDDGIDPRQEDLTGKIIILPAPEIP
jgi:hypothetical protein